MQNALLINNDFGGIDVMSEKNTKAKNVIDRFARLNGAHFDNKTVKNIEAILIANKDIQANKDYFNYSSFGSDSIEKLLPYVYKSFISSEKISDGVINRMVMQILNDKKTRDILHETLDSVLDFNGGEIEIGDDEKKKVPLGHVYHYILKNLYFTDEEATNTDIYGDLDLNQNQYSYRKKEAIMLFGITFWHKCLNLIDNWKEMLCNVMQQEGRDDLRDDCGF